MLGEVGGTGAEAAGDGGKADGFEMVEAGRCGDTKGEVVAFVEGIDEAITKADLHLHLGIVLPKLADDGGKKVHAKGEGGVDFEDALGLVMEGGNIGFGDRDREQNRLAAVVVIEACDRGADAAGRALKQLHIQEGFELGHRFVNR